MTRIYPESSFKCFEGFQGNSLKITYFRLDLPECKMAFTEIEVFLGNSKIIIIQFQSTQFDEKGKKEF